MSRIGTLVQQIPGAFIEAWEEIRVNRARVILSLVGVAAAVWAMGSVMAAGTMMVRAFELTNVAWSGIPGTLQFNATQTSSNDSDPSDPYGAGDPMSQSTAATYDADGRPIDPFGSASARVAKQMHATLWTRQMWTDVQPVSPALPDCSDSGDDDNWDSSDPCNQLPATTITGIDPGYMDIYQMTLLRGRALTENDGQLQQNPVLVNKDLWKLLGNPDLTEHPQFATRANPHVRYTIVGVVESADTQAEDQLEIYAAFDTLEATLTPDKLGEAQANQVFAVNAPTEQGKDASKAILAALQGQMGKGYSVSTTYEEEKEASRDHSLGMIQAVIGGIGAIVILIGALGLLTVSIVTIRQRVREIGIRRSMGASARRVFFAVFLESVVATTVAGALGIVASIITVRFAPYDMFHITDLSSIPYPMSAALIGLAIAAGVGALCGIIPATIAVRIKPIDAIRF
ncbi:MAG: ABC transporter permease [Actinomycetaceae bacterium]|mgnify:CR=1 FL=1|nr:ABC transporter permease [Actinomycetaceae bacterium]MDU0970684.1 ABC transporter permease [Actinomycetaceae bacterium]